MTCCETEPVFLSLVANTVYAWYEYDVSVLLVLEYARGTERKNPAAVGSFNSVHILNLRDVDSMVVAGSFSKG